MTDKKLKILNSLIKYCYYSLIFVTPFLMTSVTSELFEFNKMIFIYLTCLIIAFSWVFKMILLNKIIIKKTILDIPILLFLLSQVLSTVFSIDLHTSIFGYYGRFNGGLLSITVYILLFYGLVSNYLEFGENFINKILKTSIFSSILVIFWGLPGKIGYDLSCFLFTGQLSNNCWTNQFRPQERMFSTLGQPNWLGAYLAVNFFIGVFFFLKEIIKKDSDKITWINILITVYLVLNFISVLFTRSRSALLSVIIGIISLIIYFTYSFKKNHNLSRYFKKLGALVVCLFAAILIFKTGVSQVDRLMSLDTYTSIFKTSNKSKIPDSEQKNDKDQVVTPELFVTESGDIRRIVWKGAIDLGKQHSLFGTGVETFAYSYYFVRPKEHNLTSEWDYLYNKAHNEYLNYFATTGFVGLGSYLIFILIVILYSWQNIKYQKLNIKNTKQQCNNITILTICLLISYLTILITNFFGFSTSTINLYFYLLPALIIISHSNFNNVTMKQCNNETISSSQKLYLFILLSSTFYLLYSISTYWLADINYAKGDSLYKVGQYQQAADLLNQALKLKYEHVYEDKLSYILANLAFISGYQKETEMAKKLTDLSIYYNQKSLNASPKNVLYHKTAAKNYYLFYQNDSGTDNLDLAVASLNHARILSPTDPKIPYSLALFYSLLVDEKVFNQKKEYQDLSIKEISNSINLKPNDSSFYLLKGQLLKKYGQREEARKIFQYILDNFNSDDQEAAKELQEL